MTVNIRNTFAGAWLAGAALFTPALAEGPALGTHPPTGLYDDDTPEIDYACLVNAEGPAAKRDPDLAVICPSRQLRARRQVVFDLAGSSTPPAAPGHLSRKCGTLRTCFAAALDAEAARLRQRGTSGKFSVLGEIGGDFGFDGAVFHRDARIAGVEPSNQAGLVALGQCLKTNGGDPERCRATPR